MKDATKPPAKKKASTKTTLKNTAPTRKVMPKSKTVDAFVETPQAPASLSSPVDTSPFPYHLKWHEAGIDFELHSSDAPFMSQQAWKVQQALAGLLPLKKTPYTSYTPKTPEQPPQITPPTMPLQSPVSPSFQRQASPSATSSRPSEDVDLDELKAWVQASSARHNAKEALPPQYSNPLSAPPTVSAAVEALIQQTQQAFQAPIDAVEHRQSPPEHETRPIFSTLLQDLQAPTRTELIPLTPDFKGYLSQARFNDITEVLLLAGEYLRTHLHQSTFGSSQLKHLVESAEAGHLNHAVLERALAQRYIEVVPDLTGNATSMEYRLTHVGKTYVQQLKGLFPKQAPHLQNLKEF